MRLDKAFNYDDIIALRDEPYDCLYAAISIRTYVSMMYFETCHISSIMNHYSRYLNKGTRSDNFRTIIL